MQIRRKRMNTENYKNNPSEAKRSKKNAHDLKELEGMDKANGRNIARKFYTIARGMKTGVQVRKTLFKTGIII
jgi:hypothetical protein